MSSRIPPLEEVITKARQARDAEDRLTVLSAAVEAFLKMPFAFDFGVQGIPCSAGIVVCNSSTGPTKTLGGADCFFTVVYL